MEQKLFEERLEERMKHDPDLVIRERAIIKLQNSYGYDYDQANRMYEIMQVKQVETIFGVSLGTFAAYKVRPMVR